MGTFTRWQHYLRCKYSTRKRECYAVARMDLPGYESSKRERTRTRTRTQNANENESENEDMAMDKDNDKEKDKD